MVIAQINQNTDYDMIYKIILIGNSGVGKSSILLRYCDDYFTDSFITTIGVDFKISTVETDGKVIKLQIWDTAGQERFRAITASYYRGAHAIIVTYDVTDKESFNDVENIWLPEIIKHAKNDVKIFLVGTKIDKNDQVISKEVGQQLAKKHELYHYNVSAKKNEGIESMFNDIVYVLNKDYHSVYNNYDNDKLVKNGKKIHEQNNLCCF